MIGKIKNNSRILAKIKRICSFFKIDSSFFVMFILAFLLDELSLYFAFFIFGILHELSHFFIAKKLGYFPKKIHLSFFGASLEGCDDFFAKDEMKIVVAGPLFNFFVVCFCYLSFWFNPESYDFFYNILIANWALFLFNMLPIYPLDFGRILLVIFSQKYPRIDALKKVKNLSLVFVFALFVLFLFSFFYGYNFSFGFAIVNLAFLCLSSAKGTSYKRQLFAKRKFDKLEKGLSEKNIYVKNDIARYKLFKFIDDSHFVNFIFVDEDMKECGKMSEIDYYKENGLIWKFIGNYAFFI